MAPITPRPAPPPSRPPGPGSTYRPIPARSSPPAGSGAGPRPPSRGSGGGGSAPPSPRARLLAQLAAFALLVGVVLGAWRLLAGGGGGADASGPTVAAGATVAATSAATVAPGGGAGAGADASTASTASTVPSTGATAPPTAPATAPTTVPPTSAALRTPTAADPLRVYIAGDSLAQGYGVFLESLLGDTGVVTSSLDVKASTGLTRPDFFDWPEHLAQGLAAHDPEVVVVTFGGNDAQPLRVDGTAYDVPDAEWQAEYARRVGAAMDQLAADGRQVVWVGTPNAKSSTFTARLEVLNRIYREEAAARPGRVAYVDAWSLLAGPDGGYAQMVADSTGKLVKMRAGDGFHLTVAGATHLAKAVLAEIDRLAPLPAPAG